MVWSLGASTLSKEAVTLADAHSLSFGIKFSLLNTSSTMDLLISLPLADSRIPQRNDLSVISLNSLVQVVLHASSELGSHFVSLPLCRLW